MDRVQIAALALAVLLLFAWFATLPREPAPAPEPPMAQQADRGLPAPAEPPPDLFPPGHDAPRPSASPAAEIPLENDAVRVVVSSLGGRFQSIRLKQYRDRLGEEAEPVELVTTPSRGTGVVLLDWDALRGVEAVPHDRAERDARRVRLVAERRGIRVERLIELDEHGYGAWVRVRVQNRSPAQIAPGFELVWYGGERDGNAPDRFQNYALVVLAAGDLERRPVRGLGSKGFMQNLLGREAWAGTLYEPPVEWAGLASQYFMLAGVAENPTEARSFLSPLAPDQGMSTVRYPPFPVPPGREIERSYRVYFGPKLEADVEAVDSRLVAGLQTGWAWIRPLVVLFERLLVWTHGHIVPNYGVAIILLTILLRLATYPLTQKSMSSMRRFSEIAPEMKALQERHKGDRTRLQQEMMAMYQRKGINPVAAMGGGCLPMLIQFPFLVALYFALQGSIELRHAPFFGWIRDLSAPETLFSVAGVPVRLLPLLMGGTMVLQQRLSPTGGVDPQQRQMMTWMSVMFIFLFYQFPSGLVLYWFVSNLLGIAQQTWVNRQPIGAGRRAATRA